MAHWNVCIILKIDDSTAEELREKARAKLDLFTYEIESAPHKRYVDQEQIDGLKAHLKTEDRAVLIKEFGLSYGEECFGDEKGIYYISNTKENPDGHYHYAQLLGYVPQEDYGRAFLGEGGNRMCRALITLQGDWIDGPWHYGTPQDPARLQESNEWYAKLSTYLEENKHEAVFIADCKT